MSGRKSILTPYVIVPTAAGVSPVVTGSLAANFFSPVTVVMLGDSLTYQINITTTNSTGSFYAQASNDGVNWSDVGICGVVSAANDTSCVVIDAADFFNYRIRYASTIAGTGTCQIYVGWKAKGG